MYSCRKPKSRAKASASRLCDSGMEAESAVIATARGPSTLARRPRQVRGVGAARVRDDHLPESLQDREEFLLLRLKRLGIESLRRLDGNQARHSSIVAAGYPGRCRCPPPR